MKPIKIEDIQNPEIRKQIQEKLGAESNMALIEDVKEFVNKNVVMHDYNSNQAQVEIPTKIECDKKSNVLVVDIEPCTAPRLTRRDAIFTNPDHEDPKKRQRPQVTRYFAYKRAIKKACEDNGFELPKVLNIAFIIPMPDSWSQKKKAEMLNKPHLQTPDIDNLIKAFMDSFEKNDSFVWRLSAKKIWGYNGKVLLQKGT